VSKLTLSLFGPPSLAVPHGPTAPELRTSKCLALLAFLTLEPGPHTREELAALLWGESPDIAARASLRQALRHLRAALGEAIGVDRQTVELVQRPECDVWAFLEAAVANPSEAARFEVPRFMAGFSVPRAPAFEEWLETKRRQLHDRYEQALRSTARNALHRGRWRDALEHAERWLAADALAEEATRMAAEAEFMMGDAAAALTRLTKLREQAAQNGRQQLEPASEELRSRIESATAAHRGRSERASGPAPSFQASLVGRERQWRTLMEVWTAVERGRGGIVLIEGEVGIGKSRLAHELLRWAQAEGGTVLRGRGYDPAGTPYGPVAEALRGALAAPGLGGTDPEWLTEVTRLLPELRRRFPGLPEPPPPADPAQRWRLFEGIGQVVLTLAAERPTVLLIDDLQWCDSETCALLHFLVRCIEGASVALVATVRLGDVEREAPAARLVRSLRARGQATVVEVGPLSEEEVWLMIREMGRIRSPTAGRRFAKRIHEVTDGNPFHAIELLKTLFTRGLLAVDLATGEWTPASAAPVTTDLVPMPTTVRDAISERANKLPYQHRDLLASIAVAGSGSAALLSHAHGISRLYAAALCDALVERLLLVEEGGVYRCAHPVIADVVREELTASRRREVHRAVAFSLEAITPETEVGAVAGEVARHSERGGERGMTYRYALLACEEAVRRYAFEEALSWLDLAAGSADQGEQSDTVNRRTADILGLAGWTEPPRRARRAATPARGIAQVDMDLG
jgi:DNA-binding SARP family transcriptional activator